MYADTAAITIAPPAKVVSAGTSLKASQTQTIARGASRALTRADSVAEMSRVPSVSNRRPSPNCVVPKRARYPISVGRTFQGAATGHKASGQRNAERQAAG